MEYLEEEETKGFINADTNIVDAGENQPQGANKITNGQHQEGTTDNDKQGIVTEGINTSKQATEGSGTNKMDSNEGKGGFGELAQSSVVTGTSGPGGIQKKKTQNEKYVEFRKTHLLLHPTP